MKIHFITLTLTASSQILVIDVSPSSAHLATVNGFAQMVQNLMMAVAPAAVTSLFALSIANQWLMGGRMVYVVMFGLSVVGAVVSWGVGERDEKEEGELDE